MPPPRIARDGRNEWLKLGKLGLDVRRMGKDEFRELLRMILINVADVLEDDLDDDRLRGAVAFDTVLGAWLGPRSPNSLILLLNRIAGEAAGQKAALALPKGGMDRSLQRWPRRRRLQVSGCAPKPPSPEYWSKAIGPSASAWPMARNCGRACHFRHQPAHDVSGSGRAAAARRGLLPPNQPHP